MYSIQNNISCANIPVLYNVLCYTFLYKVCFFISSFTLNLHFYSSASTILYTLQCFRFMIFWEHSDDLCYAQSMHNTFSDWCIQGAIASSPVYHHRPIFAIPMSFFGLNSSTLQTSSACTEQTNCVSYQPFHQKNVVLVKATSCS